MTLNNLYQEIITWFDGTHPLLNETINTINGLIHNINGNVTSSTAMLRIMAKGDRIEDMDTVKIEDMSTTKIEDLGLFGENFDYDEDYYILTMKLPVTLVKAIWMDGVLWECREFDDVKRYTTQGYYYVAGNKIYFSQNIKAHLENSTTNYLTLLVEMLYSTYGEKDKDTEFSALNEYRALFISGSIFMLGAKKKYNESIGAIGLKTNKDIYDESLKNLYYDNLNKDNFGSYCSYGQAVDLGLSAEPSGFLPTDYGLLIVELAAGIVYIGTEWKIVEDGGDLVTYKLIGGVWVEMDRIS